MSRPLLLLAALGAALLACIVAGLAAQPPGAFGGLNRDDAWHYVSAALAAGLAYAAAVLLVRRTPLPAPALPLILVIGLAARLLVLAPAPFLSTDIYRYVWDGRVQAAGINPYRHLPADPALAPLRDTTPGPTAIYPNINRADFAPTIYPPAAQALFGLMAHLAPGVWPMKAAMLAFDCAVAALALALLRTATLPAALVLVWAWNPLVIWEFANAGHIDAAAIAFSAAAMLAAVRLRPALAGGLLAIAIMMKLIPAAIGPALWRMPLLRRTSWRLPAAALATIALGYAAYASVGLRVLGYLPGYASEEGLDNGGGFLPLRLLAIAGPVPAWSGPAYIALALAILATLALWVVRRPLPAAAPARAKLIARDALILAGATLALLSPHYPWYLTLLILPAILCPAWSALWPSLAGPLLYFDHGRDEWLWPAIVFLPCLPLLALDLSSLSLWERTGVRVATTKT